MGTYLHVRSHLLTISCSLLLSVAGDWATEGIGAGMTTTTTQQQPPIPTPGGFLGAGDHDWTVDTTTTKDWAEDNGGEWGGDAQVRRKKKADVAIYLS